MDVRRHFHAAAASFWREWHRDLRRHAADVRIPYPIRVRLRDAAEHALRRSSLEETRGVAAQIDRRAMLDHRRGYVKRKQGILKSDPEMGSHYHQFARHERMLFDDRLCEMIERAVKETCPTQAWRLHAVVVV